MIRHLFKLIWNQKRKNLGLSFELLFSFLVLFGVFSFSFFFLKRYSTPLGFKYDNVWAVMLNKNQTPDSVAIQTQDLMEQRLASFKEIKEFARSGGNIPFSNYSIINSVQYGDKDAGSDFFTGDEHLLSTLNLEMVEGRWFKPEDHGAEATAVVITKELKEKLFEEDSALGKIILNDEKKCKVIGICKNYRYRGDMEQTRNGLFTFQDPTKPSERILLKVSAEADATFEAKLLKSFQDLAPSWSIEINYLDEMREDKIQLRLLPILILSIICGFLIFNVALGLFGVLWQNISKRKDEIGIRRAMGSTQGEITFQFVGETIVLATLSIILGLFFAIQFPLLNIFNVSTDIYIWAIIAAMLFIYLLVFLCAVFPSAQAAKLHPATALREE